MGYRGLRVFFMQTTKQGDCTITLISQAHFDRVLWATMIPIMRVCSDVGCSQLIKELPYLTRA